MYHELLQAVAIDKPGLVLRLKNHIARQSLSPFNDHWRRTVPGSHFPAASERHE